LDSFFTLNRESQSEIKIKGSRFLGYAKPVADRNEAEFTIREASKKYYDATHHCFAYCIGSGDRAVYRYSDGGEPSGTAGKPILEAIHGRSLTNVVCMVIRYFGGTKLGTGGLFRAYTKCAGITLDQGGKKEKYSTVHIELTFDYNVTGTIMSTLSKFDCRILKTTYSDETHLSCSIRTSQTSQFERTLRDLTGGRIKIQREGVTNR